MTAGRRDPVIDPLYTTYAEQYDQHQPGTTGDIDFYRELALEAGGLVVELGVGTGRVAIPLARAGVSMLGLDLSRQMLAVAARKARAAGVSERLALARADMRRFALVRPAALVTIPARAFLHLLTTDDQLSTLASCRAALQPGGRLALNVFNPDLPLIVEWMRRDPEQWGEADLGLPDTEERRDYDPSEQHIDLYVRYRGREASFVATRLRWVYRYEMEHLLARSGFAVEALYGDFERAPFGRTSTEMVWVARAVGP